MAQTRSTTMVLKKMTAAKADLMEDIDTLRVFPSAPGPDDIYELSETLKDLRQDVLPMIFQVVELFWQHGSPFSDAMESLSSAVPALEQISPPYSRRDLRPILPLLTQVYANYDQSLVALFGILNVQIPSCSEPYLHFVYILAGILPEIFGMTTSKILDLALSVLVSHGPGLLALSLCVGALYN